MKLSDKISIINSAARAKLFNISTPLIVSWIITGNCNYACKYCADCQLMNSGDLNVEQILSIIDRLAKMGTKVISFTGGEPLLRKDLGRIIDYCAEKGIITGVNSNGSLVQDKITELANLDALVLSLDGPQKVNDSARGEGSFKNVMNAVDAARKKNIKIKFLAVLSKFNLDLNAINYLLNKAEELSATVTFQPAIQQFLRGEGLNPFAPPEKEYKQAIDYLISEKKRNNQCIGNSLACLWHLRGWPNPGRIKCAGGLIYHRIDNKGNVMICGMRTQPWKARSCIGADFKKVFLNENPVYCDSCWCAARLEVNYAFSGNFNAIFHLVDKLFSN